MSSLPTTRPIPWRRSPRPYFEAPAGLPLVQHSLQMLMECHLAGKIPLTAIPEKAAHNPAILFGIADRGFVREGYYADLVVVDVNESEGGHCRGAGIQVRLVATGRGTLRFSHPHDHAERRSGVSGWAGGRVDHVAAIWSLSASSWKKVGTRSAVL